MNYIEMSKECETCRQDNDDVSCIECFKLGRCQLYDKEVKMNRSTICCNCKYYPCRKTNLIDAFLKDMECEIRLSLNGCSEFKEA